MSLDQRLRTGLERNPGYRPAVVAQASVAGIVERAERRRRVRLVIVGALAAAACLLLVLIVPTLVSGQRSIGPVDEPTETTSDEDAWRPTISTSPVDGKTWTATVVGIQGRRTELVGTPLDRFAERVYERSGLDDLPSTAVYFWMGQARVSMPTTHVDPGWSRTGTFTVQGHRVVIRLDGWKGTTTFVWQKLESGRLKLTLERTTVGPLFGAPAEVFFRMWSAQPFTMRLGY
jgi:hypothetical protein